MRHIFGFTDDYTKVTYGMRDTLQLIRKDDNDALFRSVGAGAGKVVLSKLAWVVPIVQPNDVLKVNLYNNIAANNTIPVGFRRRQCEAFTLPQARSTVWRLGVSSAPENHDGYWLDCKQARVVTRRGILPFLIIATRRICRCV